jgi:DNA-binding NarL/FixJ family response regulator
MGVRPEATAIRILVVDDSRHFLDAARGVLERDGVTVVGVASASADAMRLAVELRPDVILVDIDLGEESGLCLAEQLVAAVDARVVLISVYPESEIADLVAASPAAGFVAKSKLSANVVLDVVRSGRSDD